VSELLVKHGEASRIPAFKHLKVQLESPHDSRICRLPPKLHYLIQAGLAHKTTGKASLGELKKSLLSDSKSSALHKEALVAQYFLSILAEWSVAVKDIAERLDKAEEMLGVVNKQSSLVSSLAGMSDDPELGAMEKKSKEMLSSLQDRYVEVVAGAFRKTQELCKTTFEDFVETLIEVYVEDDEDDEDQDEPVKPARARPAPPKYSEARRDKPETPRKSSPKPKTPGSSRAASPKKPQTQSAKPASSPLDSKVDLIFEDILGLHHGASKSKPDSKPKTAFPMDGPDLVDMLLKSKGSSSADSKSSTDAKPDRAKSRVEELRKKEEQMKEEADLHDAVTQSLLPALVRWEYLPNGQRKPLIGLLSTVHLVAWENSTLMKTPISIASLTSPEVVKKTVRKVQFESHPDRHVSSPVDHKVIARHIFEAITAAFDTWKETNP